ncbi:MAG: PaaI family thioesterase [Sandaracinaceae bacterium]|nr:PaaI family thioesterase [Myxococcales bacterium]MCB9660412.1 PaaI family thioesterase [Sandaracinaceae bacterium]
MSPSITINPEHVEAIKALVAQAPFPAHMAMRLTAMDLDTCVVELAADKRHLQPYGILHGGVLATLLDTATFWSAYMRIPESAGLVNVDLKLNYLASVSGGLLTCEGRCVRPGRTISYAEAWVRDADGQLLAHGTSSLLAMPGKGLSLGVPKFLHPETP